MAPRGRKRKSDESTSATQDAPGLAEQKIATKSGNSSESPTKKRKIGITLAQKQALIDNLQLELTERARKLRAQYNLQAQGLRTRIEIRVNRIPMALRKAKMGDLVQQYSSDQAHKPKASAVAAVAAMVAKPPPVPEKDYFPTRPVSHRASPAPVVRAGPGRPRKRSSDQMAGGDKENHDANIENPEKKIRGHHVTEGRPDPGKVLSPASSNSRLNPRERAPASPAKSLIARPVSPVKQASSTNLLSNMVEKARATRAATTRKTTTSSTASSAAGGPAATRTRRGAAATAPTVATTTRTARRISGISESSDGSTSTVIRKTAGRGAATSAKAAPAAKRTVMSTIKKGMTSATTRKPPASKAAPPAATTRSGRVLRKRE